ncbi:hypothetical protein NCC49_005220 [Naganishia albida]|nr:hypothetical protein NCC49_005220 [Naganishia albida]
MGNKKKPPKQKERAAVKSKERNGHDAALRAGKALAEAYTHANLPKARITIATEYWIEASAYPVQTGRNLIDDRTATQEGLGVVHPDDFDLDMVVRVLGMDFPGNVYDNYPLDCKFVKLGPWQKHMKEGKLPAEFVPKPVISP